MGRSLIGYFTSEYPSISHTFIRREVLALRRRGLEIRTFSVRRPPADAPLSESDQRERAQTWYLQPPSVAALLLAHVREFGRGPLRYLRAIALAIRSRVPGARSALWSLFYFAEGVVLADALRSARIHHLHVHFAQAGADVARIACFLCGISWSLTLHGTADVEYPAVLTLGEKIRDASFTACASYFVRAQALRTIEPSSWDRLTVVRCGVEIPEKVATPEAAERVRILCVGRLSSEKGHSGLLEVLADIQGRIAPFSVTVIGDGPMRAELQARARELALSDCVEFVGARSEQGVMKALWESDLLVLPSLMEGLSTVLIEAMAHSVPVIAPRVAGNPELVTDEIDGLLFTPSDWAGLSAQVRRLIADPALRARLGAAGRIRVAGEFAIDRAVEPLWKRFTDHGGG
jgi:glycosyltransferase involved in cell wall biosynthesis